MYSGNRYLSLNEMRVNAQYILDYLLKRGWTKEAICAMLGNMEMESTINPGIWESLKEGNTLGGFGLVQWTPASKYLDWADLWGLQRTSIESQLERILYEVEKNIQWIPRYNDITFKKFTTSKGNPSDMALIFANCYERPFKVDIKRGEYAMYWYETLKGGDNVEQVKVKLSSNGSVSPNDIFISVRVEEDKAEQAIKDINKLGFAAKRMELA